MTTMKKQPNAKELILVHLSDIHFRREISGTIYDQDVDVRNELEKDAQKMQQQLGEATGLVVTGDIAFAGKEEEYKIALQWLEKLCDIVRCSPEKVWTSPGNHDVDRSVIANSATLQDYHEKFRSIDVNQIDQQITKYMQDKIAQEMLFLPVANYNSFASAFKCQVNADRLYWEDDLELNDRSILRLRGLHSTLISDHQDNDAAYKLVLGTIQASPPSDDGVVYLTLCHHPPQWLRDEDEVVGYLNRRVHIQLFGHKHKQKVEGIDNCVRITAGAMHPDRREPNWQPRYNWLAIKVIGTDANRQLEVRIYPRVWSDNDKMFVADFDKNGSEFRRYSLTLEPWSAPVIMVKEEIAMGSSVESASTNQPDVPRMEETVPEEGQSMNRARRLTYRFYTLPYRLRIKVAQELDLIRDEDKGIPDSELFSHLYQRAKEGKQLERLWGEVEKNHGDNRFPENPFVGE